MFYRDVWKLHNNSWKTFVKISETHWLCICFKFTSQGSLKLHTLNAGASVKRDLELQGSQPNQHSSFCTHPPALIQSFYCCSGETGKKYSAGRLAREFKDHVYQQWVVDMWSETPDAKDLNTTLYAFQVVLCQASSRLWPWIECQSTYFICSSSCSRSSALSEHTFQFSFIQRESSLQAPRLLLHCTQISVKRENWNIYFKSTLLIQR